MAIGRLKQNTHVIYLGDGIVTAADGDSVAFSKRLKDRISQSGKVKDSTFHSVALGSSYEAVTLNALASVGGGSVRRIEGAQGPQKVALTLLKEISQPGLTDLQLEFKGFRTARVYPDELPNLAAGTQQIVIGRYLPPEDDSKQLNGEVIVSAKQNGKPVQFSTKVEFAGDDEGNSFLPRLSFS